MVVDTLVANLDGGSGGVSVDSEGNIFVADFGAILGDRKTMGTKVFRVTPNGETSVFAAGFEGASGNEIDSEGSLYQSNIRGNCINKVSPSGVVSQFCADGILGPVGIAIDREDQIYVANCNGNTIQKITRDGVSKRFAKSKLFKCPNGLTFDENAILYVANFDNGDVLRVDPKGHVTKFASIPGNNNGHLTYFDGSIYVVGRSAHRVFRVSIDGEVSAFAGSGVKGRADGPAEVAQFCYPNDIEISHDRSCFYVNDIDDTTTDGMKLAPMSVRRIIL